MDFTSAISGAKNAFIKKAEEVIANPTPANTLAFDAARQDYLVAGMTSAQFLAARKEAREAVNRILNRTVDTIA